MTFNVSFIEGRKNYLFLSRLTTINYKEVTWKTWLKDRGKYTYSFRCVPCQITETLTRTVSLKNSETEVVFSLLCEKEKWCELFGGCFGLYVWYIYDKSHLVRKCTPHPTKTVSKWHSVDVLTAPSQSHPHPQQVCHGLQCTGAACRVHLD